MKRFNFIHGDFLKTEYCPHYVDQIPKLKCWICNPKDKTLGPRDLIEWEEATENGMWDSKNEKIGENEDGSIIWKRSGRIRVLTLEDGSKIYDEYDTTTPAEVSWVYNE